MTQRSRTARRVPRTHAGAHIAGHVDLLLGNVDLNRDDQLPYPGQRFDRGQKAAVLVGS